MENSFSLNGHGFGQRAHADCRAGVLLGLAYDLDLQARAAVEDLGVIGGNPAWR
ncbi:hypothetical protein J4G37_30190 [Microvirga sp. 3-52]|nr:hypothetical protein [Microvirga sp. 3-52]